MISILPKAVSPCFSPFSIPFLYHFYHVLSISARSSRSKDSAKSAETPALACGFTAGFAAALPPKPKPLKPFLGHETAIEMASKWHEDHEDIMKI